MHNSLDSRRSCERTVDDALPHRIIDPDRSAQLFPELRVLGLELGKSICFAIAGAERDAARLSEFELWQRWSDEMRDLYAGQWQHPK